MTIPRLLVFGLLASISCLPASGASPAFESRKQQMIEFFAGPSPQKDPNWGGYGNMAAKLYLKQDVDFVNRRMQKILEDPSGDMFWMFQMVAVEYAGRGMLTAETQAKIRHAWKHYFPFRGDTENHWLLYYVSLYLASQIAPPDAEWFTGKTSKENMQEAAAYLKHWMELTLDKGQGEYDCTHYIGVYLLPMSYLAAWAEDKEIRQRGRMMMEYIIADFAVESLDGVYAGSHARTDDVQVLEKGAGVSSDFGWLLFGQGPRMPIHSGYALFYALASGWEPTEILQRIATDRSKPYVHYEKKRTRHRWRFHDERNGKVFKTTYMTPNYAVGSDQGGVLQPIQQHSWDVTWRVPDSKGVHNTLFTTHPYSSLHELQTYFTPMPDYFLDEVLRSKKTYDSPDKWIGGSPYEKIAQDLDTVVVLYSIPEKTRFPHIHGFFSKDLQGLTERSGWIFARGGDAFLAYRPLAPYVWKPMENGGKELFSPHLRNGAIVQVSDQSEWKGDFMAFQQKILALPLEVKMDPVPSVAITTLRGRRMEFTWGQTPRVEGKPIAYEKWPMFGGPFLNAAPGARRLVLTHGKMRRVLDFNNLTIQDSVSNQP